VVAEGCHLPEGGQCCHNEILEVKRNERRLVGAGQYVADKIAELSGLESRIVVLGHVQRGGSPTCFDRLLATKFGSVATKLACEGDYGKMVALRGTQIVSVPITGEIQQQRTVNIKEEQLVWAARSTGIAFGDEQ